MSLDGFTEELLDQLAGGGDAPADEAARVAALLAEAEKAEGTAPIVRFFTALKEAKRGQGLGYDAFGLPREALVALAERHAAIDEHGVTIGGRVGQGPGGHGPGQPPRGGLPGPQGRRGPQRHRTVGLHPRQPGPHQEDPRDRDDATWNSFGGQLSSAINDVETLARCIDLPADTIRDVTRITKKYRMRLTPYYASLIQPGVANDPVLLQSVPTAEMVDNVGVELPPVASDHSPRAPGGPVLPARGGREGHQHLRHVLHPLPAHRPHRQCRPAPSRARPTRRPWTTSRATSASATCSSPAATPSC